MLPVVPVEGLAAVIETAWLPPITVTPAASGSRFGVGAAVALLKPKVTVYANGTPIYALAPAGEPGETKWPLLMYAAFAIPLYFAVRYMARRSRRSR